jgi:Protein of unknown function, DUF547
METKKSTAKSVAPFVVLGLGFLLVLLNAVSHAGDFFAPLFLRVDHPLTCNFNTYDTLLKSVVKDDRVDYETLKKSKLLNEAIADLSKTSPDHLDSPDEQLCFWINSYNLLVLKAVTDAYPIRTVRQSLNSFGTTKFLIGAKPYSLNDIYQNYLVPRLKKNRNAFFLVCGGSLGYPPLLDHAIRPATLTADSEQAAKKFINNSQNVYYMPGGKVFGVSPLLKWNEAVLGDPHLFAAKYLPASKLMEATNVMATDTVARDFNWWLNDTATATRKNRN